MLDITIEVTGQGILSSYEQALKLAFDYTFKAVAIAITPLLPELQKYLERKPGSVVYPIQWKSERQRRAYFATNGFERGIPYVRSSKPIGYVTAFQKTGSNQAQLTVTTNWDALKFVKGEDQQPFHFTTGWDMDRATYAWEAQKIEDVVYPAINAAWQPGAVQAAFGGGNP